MSSPSLDLPTLGRLRRTVRTRGAAALEQVSGHRYALYGLSVMRIGYGLVLVAMLLLNYRERRLLWGPESPWTYEIFRKQQRDLGSWSVYQVSDSGVWFELLYHLTIVLCVLFVLGWRTRWIAPFLVIAVWSWQQRNPGLTDGGDVVLRLMLFYLCFAQTSAHWSLDARRAARWATDRGPGHERLGWRVGTVLHNGAVLAAMLQVCLLYMASGLFKAQGQDWQDGTALYYMLQLETLQAWPGLNRLVYTQAMLLVIAAYLAVFLQVSFPFLILNPVTRRFALLGVVGMHLGIGVLMGLPFFSLIMIVTDMLFIRDNTYRRVSTAAARLWRDRRTRRQGRSDLTGSPASLVQAGAHSPP